MKSIRSHLLACLVIGLLLLFTVTGAGFHHFTRDQLISQFDESLLGRARVLANLTEIEQSGVLDFEFANLPLLEYLPGEDAEYFQVWTPQGDSLVRSRSLESADITLSEIPHTNPSTQSITLPDGRSGRAAVLRYSVSGATPSNPSAPAADLVLVVARSRENLDSSLAWIHRALLALGTLVTIGSALIVWISLVRGLRPLTDIAAKAASIDPDCSDQQFPIEDIPRELEPICAQLNRMLRRLEGAIERERRITASLAHELRTPIAELRTLSEVGILSEGVFADGGEVKIYFKDTLLIAEQMERLVSTLLALYRCQTWQIRLQPEPLDLRQVIREAWDAHAPLAAEKGIDAQFELPAGVVRETDRALLAAVLHSLLSNAVAHTPAGGHIRCEADARTVRIVNTADGFAPEDLDQIFEPLWRRDTARSESQHLGLGLTLVAAYGRLLGLEVDADLPRPGEFRITVTFPPITDARETREQDERVDTDARAHRPIGRPAIAASALARGET